MSREYDNTNRGALFKNDKEGGNPNWPDYRGNINVKGEEFWLDAWIKEDKKGKKYMSLSCKPKLQSDRSSPPTGGKSDQRPARDDFEDTDIPF
jgi:hypothetical protein